jgi:hypothetical protein
MLANNNGESVRFELIELDMTTGLVRRLLENVKNVLSFSDNKLVYTTCPTSQSKKGSINILNVDTLAITSFESNNIVVEGFIDHYVIYTQLSPNKYNKNLYIKDLEKAASSILIEKNIYRFRNVVDNKLFYDIGNSTSTTLVTNDCTGANRKEWPLYISDVLLEQGGWLYFVRKAGYTSILCKSRPDGSKFSIIASDIEEFIEIKNGYLYYINDSATLIRVRMDGSNLQELCENVMEVLSVKEDRIIFVSSDDPITVQIGDQIQRKKLVKSIYAVDFSGSGKIKLLYDVNSFKKYDEKTVYYTTNEKPALSSNAMNDALYRLNVETYQTDKLLDIKTEEPKKTSGFTIAMIIMIFSFLLFLIGIGSEAPGMTAFGLISAFVSLIVGIFIKSSEST